MKHETHITLVAWPCLAHKSYGSLRSPSTEAAREHSEEWGFSERCERVRVKKMSLGYEPEDLTVKLMNIRITWGLPDHRELEAFGCCWAGAPFFSGGGTCACGVAKCCWWQVLARGGPPRTLVKFKLTWGGRPKFSQAPHPTGEHQLGLFAYFCNVFRRCVGFSVASAPLWRPPSSICLAGAAL